MDHTHLLILVYGLIKLIQETSVNLVFNYTALAQRFMINRLGFLLQPLALNTLKEFQHFFHIVISLN